MGSKVLKQQIADLPFVQGLKELLLMNKIKTLEDLLKLPVHEWHKQLPGFTYHFQQEIVNYLQKNNLMSHLKEE